MPMWCTRFFASILIAICLGLSLCPRAHSEAAFVEGHTADGGVWHSHAFNSLTVADAIATAMSNCTRHAFNCRVLNQFNSTCFALAYANRGGYGYGFGWDDATAHREALKQCITANPYDTCNIVRSFCDTVDAVLTEQLQQQEKARQSEAAEAAEADVRYYQHFAKCRDGDNAYCDGALAYAKTELDRATLLGFKQANTARLAQQAIPAPAPVPQATEIPATPVMQHTTPKADTDKSQQQLITAAIIVGSAMLLFGLVIGLMRSRRPIAAEVVPSDPLMRVSMDLPPKIPPTLDAPPDRSDDTDALSAQIASLRPIPEDKALVVPTVAATAIDTPAAQRALKIAHAFLQETLGQSFDDLDAAKSARTTLSLASRQLEKARTSDPYARLETDNETLISQERLRSRVLCQEAMTWAQENIAKAASIAARATAADPTDAVSHHTLGMLYFENRNRAGAIAALSRALELDPDDIDTMKLLDRAENMGTTEIATYKVTKAGMRVANTGIGVYNAGVRTRNFFVIIWNIFATIWNTITWPMRFMGRIVSFLSGGRL